jgi:hypothetical protein
LRSNVKPKNRKPMLKKPRRPGSYLDLRDKLDSLTAHIVKTRDHHRCVQCGSTYMIDCGHIYSRTLKPTRFSLENCHAQCRRCNTRHIDQPEFYILWFRGKFGSEKLVALRDFAYSDKEYSLEEMAAMIVEYEQTLKDVRAESEMRAA